jgi:acyl dehydratase
VSPYSVRARNIDPEADNAIHADDVAQQHGFSGALVPGVDLFAYATSPLVAAWGPSWLSSGLVDLRFRRPVYDGETLTVALTGSSLAVTGPDGVVRCVGSASPSGGSLLGSYVDAPLPAVLPADPVLGPLGTVVVPGAVADNVAYLDAIAEPVPLYRDQAVAHPGLLLRLVNLLLMRNVALGPWVHTSSRCRFLGLASLPAEMAVRGTVTELFQRGGHDYVRYDALVLADDRPVLEVDHTAIYRLG